MTSAILIYCRQKVGPYPSQFTSRNTDEGIGICYTRTGRRFFNESALESAFLAQLHSAISSAGWWEKFETSWVCLDCELMPRSAKAQDLLRRQYAAVGAAALASLTEAMTVLEEAAAHHSDAVPLLTQYQQRQKLAEQYVAAYGHYCWPVHDLSDLKLAPFHLLATENKVHTDKSHLWQMETLAELCRHNEDLLLATPYQVIDVTDPDRCEQGSQWWEALTAAGGEGIVIKPLDFIARNRRGLIQPAIKSRGREYLRIIYGPEYTAAENLERLRSRGLSAKRSLALREFALGLEALERFARREPLYRVHECVFGILALESEPVDPRL